MTERVTFDVPAAPTELRLAGEATTTLATCAVGAERDELGHSSPAYVTLRDATSGGRARVDPKAFPMVSSPELRPPPPVETAPPSVLASNPRVLVESGFTSARGRARRCWAKAQRGAGDGEAGMQARPARVLCGARTFRLRDHVIYGRARVAPLVVTSAGACSSFAMASRRIVRRRRSLKPRRPGEWQPVPMLGSAKALLPWGMLDLGGWSGRIVFALGLVVIAAASWFLRVKIPDRARAAACGRRRWSALHRWRAQMPPAPVDLTAAQMLRPARDALASSLDLTHVELKTIAASPRRAWTRSASPGAEGSDAGAPARSSSRWRPRRAAGAPAPRCSCASMRHRRRRAASIDLPPGQRILRGRTKDENVVRLLPESPPRTPQRPLVARFCSARGPPRMTIAPSETNRSSRRIEPRRRMGAGASRALFRGRDCRVAPMATALCRNGS